MARISFLLALASLVAACGTRYTVDDKVFETKQEALDDVRAKIESELGAPAEPLAAPIAGQLVVVLPSAEQMRRLLRQDHPDQPAATIDLASEAEPLIWSLFTDAIERRNIFASVRRVSAETPAGIDIPGDGYLIWIEKPNSEDEHLHIMASGESRTTRLDEGEWDEAEIKNLGSGAQALAAVTERFVRSHPPQSGQGAPVPED